MTEKTSSPEEQAANALRLAAEARKADAEAAQAQAQARLAEAQAADAEAKARKAVVEANEQERKERAELLKNTHWHHYYFGSEVGASSIDSLITQFVKWEREAANPNELKILLEINSPGGGILDLFRGVNYIKRLQGSGVTVDTYVSGEAFSAAGVLAQVGNHRTMGPYAQFLIHRASFGVQGSAENVEDSLAWVKNMEKMLISIYEDRSKDEEGNPRLTSSRIKRNWDRKNWILEANDCLKYGVVDEVASFDPLNPNG